MRIAVSAVLVAFVCVNLIAVESMAQCDSDDDEDACVEHHGDNKTSVDIDGEGTGGDAIAGSQVISVAGAQGNVNITANNNSRNADAKGGDAEANVNTNVTTGPRINVTAPVENSTANAVGTAQTLQNAAPTVTISLNQFAFPTGEAFLSSAALASTTMTGANVASGAPIAAAPAPINQTIAQLASVPITNDAAPVVNLSGANTAFITGAAAVSQLATAAANPTAIAFGGSAAATAVGIVQSAQSAAPSVATSLNQVANPIGDVVVSNTIRPLITFEALNSATGVGGGGPVNQSIAQTATSPISNTVTPVLTITADNVASVIGSAPVTQLGTATTAPRATALGSTRDTTADLFHVGDNVSRVDNDFDIAGGDAVAGSNVIGLAGISGNATVTADNTSVNADARGGTSALSVQNDVRTGPELTVLGGAGAASAVAAGVAAQAQTAAPSVVVGVAQQTSPSGVTADVSGTLGTATTLNAANVATAMGGPIVQNITQAGTTTVQQTLLGTFGVLGTSNATISASAPVAQSGTAQSSPSAAAASGATGGVALPPIPGVP